MSSVSVNDITKSFGDTRAVDGVSFDVNPGEIFGLLGPNGAGKTTTIRILLDIFKPDSGTISILGGPMTEQKKDRIGYLPEERGLYQDITLERCLTYLASLKGLTGPEAQRRISEYLQRFDLADHRSRKVKELSKGMQQKAQLIVTLVHQPEVIIIDEPFSALDPVNTQMIKDLLLEERDRGTTIIMSTHQMHQVEELCDRIVLIDKGRTVLYGDLHEIQHRFSGREINIRSTSPLPSLEGVEKTQGEDGSQRISLAPGFSPQQILRQLVEKNVPIEGFEVALPSLDEIFIKVVQGEE